MPQSDEVQEEEQDVDGFVSFDFVVVHPIPRYVLEVETSLTIVVSLLLLFVQNSARIIVFATQWHRLMPGSTIYIYIYRVHDRTSLNYFISTIYI